MRTEDKMKIQNSILRIAVSFLSIVMQIVWISVLFFILNKYSAIISVVISISAFIISVVIFNKEDSPTEFKTPLIMLILALPIVGLCMFFLIGRRTTKKMKKRFGGIHDSKNEYFTQDEMVIKRLEQEDIGVANQFRYLSETEQFPAFDDSVIDFFSEAKEAYDDMLNCIRKAVEFVFIEYHAIEDGYSFSRLRKILEKKVKEGVEVRIMYDDVGSIGFLNGSFRKKMEQIGIQCKVFNRISPVYRLFMNNRDHRKIVVVDGINAYTGGYNLADEYFGVTHPYGKWKDSGVVIRGNAVNSMTEMFLAMWNSTENVTEDFKKYYRQNLLMKAEQEKEFIQPYADNPLDNAYVGENAYLNMIQNAKKSLYISTPYLVIGDTMKRELTLAAQRGIDVRIITPGVPDKKLIYRVTRSYYEYLTKRGVKIYEYSPGFLHAKQMLADDQVAIVGTINMDYRSFYHHFENAVLMFRSKAVSRISSDFQNLLAASQEVTEEYREEKHIRFGMLDVVLRLFAPLF